MKYEIDNTALLANFLQYVQINTRSDQQAPQDRVPTTEGQTKLAQLLATQLKDLGLQEVKINPQNAFLTALLPGNSGSDLPALGFIAHLDTADYASEKVNPQVHPNYQGQAIKWENGLELSPEKFPNLKNYLGQTLITTDGTTLLGVDDKAGIAGLIGAVTYLVNHPEVKHGALKVAFGPDEEIGRGADRFDVADFQARWAYTLDNGLVGDIEYETFNAAQAEITITGTSVHPGQAYGQLVNAITLAEEFDRKVPVDQRAEEVSGRDGFYLLVDFSAKIETARLVYIVRDFDYEQFLARKQVLQTLVERLNQKYGDQRFAIKMFDQYYNMADIIKKDPTPVKLAQQALRNLQITPRIISFRGGTDGSKITYLGLPTPNLFNGGENFHGPYEFVTVEALSQLAQTIIEISHLQVK
ncbi:peptidase T [Lactobacillus sp. DCY120]|uniref:Peptidase T n=1 Tax=Bombilactobacillus apium TaxID=2675299 RepID=A0A850QZ08_9LACO|nr:peptidase T [Bombilactobacillus apium]NVY97074.1 peptidase T [Bombilactobacillus apium]